VYVHATPAEVLYWSSRIGWMLIRNGCEIVIEPREGVEERILRLYILGPALGIVLHQRNDLVLHGSVVTIGSGAVAFLGQPGQGKSTLAAALNRRGHSVVADDVADVRFQDGLPLLFPGFPYLKLSDEAAAAVGHKVESGTQGRIAGEKSFLRTADSLLQAPLPLHRIYVLNDGEMNEIRPLQPQEALMQLVRHTYVILLISPTGASASHFNQCTELARRVPVCHLTRRRTFEALEDAAYLIEQDVMRAG
jgi:hypothetical protein